MILVFLVFSLLALTKPTPSRGDGSEQRMYHFLVQEIAVGVRNDQMLEVTLLIFDSQVSFGVGSNTRISGGGSNLIEKVPRMERLPWRFSILENR